MKEELKKLNKTGFLDIEAEMIKVASVMEEIQRRMHSFPEDTEIADQEIQIVREYKTRHDAYMSFLQQKAKVKWLKEGDENTTVFHQSIMQRRVRNSVYGIYNMAGEWQDGGVAVKEAFLEYYHSLLGTTAQVTPMNFEIVRAGNTLTREHKNSLMCPFSPAEVRTTMFSIGGNKAPRPDGFVSFYFRDAWPIVGEGITTAVA